MSAHAWPLVRLGELFDVKHGFAFKGEYFADSGELVLLTPGNFRAEGGLQLRGDREKYYAGPVPHEYVLSRGDLLVAMTDLTQASPILGSALVIPQDGRFLHNQRLGKIVNVSEDKVLREFLYWIFNSRLLREAVKGSATGATVRHTAPERIKAVSVPLPSLTEQRVISRVLDAYESLIENNLRRVSLLEDMARSVYREWFVDLRFPGYRDEERSGPAGDRALEGWRRTRLGDVLELVYGKALRQAERRTGEFPVFGSSGVVGTHDRALVQGPGVVVGRKGNVGSIFWSDSGFWPIDTVYFVRADLPLRFLYWELQHKRFLNSDSAVPGLNREQAYSLPVILPPSELIQRFVDAVEPMGMLASTLRRQVETLRTTRDLLLPRLMSGQLTLREAEAAL